MQKDKFKLDVLIPSVQLISSTPLVVSEIAARTCYDSFDKSEEQCIQELKEFKPIEGCEHIKDYKLLHDLAWVYHHTSILEHVHLNFRIKNMSRGVLQELVRHRVQNISVRSTRYTMTDIINIFVTTIFSKQLSSSTDKKQWFYTAINNLDMFVTQDKYYNRIEINSMYDKLIYVLNSSKLAISDMLSSESMNFLKEYNNDNGITDMDHPEVMLKELYTHKSKRNAGDYLKHIVTDNWKVELVSTFNIRSLRNFLSLRDSGAAFFQIEWLAKEFKKQIPEEYLNLIVKK